MKKSHKILMSDEARETTANGGEFKKLKNFIGPDNKIEHASYIPIGIYKIAEHMTNLEFFANSEPHKSLVVEGENGFEYINYNSDALLRITVVHTQFESIHLFFDENSRLSRILIVLMAVKEKLLDFLVFFVSEGREKELDIKTL